MHHEEVFDILPRVQKGAHINSLERYKEVLLLRSFLPLPYPPTSYALLLASPHLSHFLFGINSYLVAVQAQHRKS